MGMCRHLWIHDDFAWQYLNDRVTKQTVDAQIKAVDQHAERAADFACWMVYDIGKTPPHLFAGRVACDAMFSTEDQSGDPTPKRVEWNARENGGTK